MKIVTVIPLKKGLPKEDLTYFSGKVTPTGSIVTIPIRNKNTLGLVVGSEDVSEAKGDIKNMDFNLKKIIDIKETSFFLKEYLDATIEISKYFIGSKNNVITSLIPALLRERYDEISKYLTPTLSLIRRGGNSIKAEKLVYQAPFEDRVSTYRTLIRSSFAEKKSIFIVMPTENDIKSFYEILSKGIEQFTFKLHRRQNEKKTLETIKQIVILEHPILILATAPYLSIPRPDIGTIILEHESSNAYKMITRPYIDLRIFTELFASKLNVKFILSDTILRFETIAKNKDKSNVDSISALQPLSFRINFDGKINIAKRGEKFKILEEETLQEIHTAISKKKNVLVYSLRKGLATQTICRDCNATLFCDTCLAPVVLYLSRDGTKRIFSCNRCKRQLDPETKCLNCQSWNLMPLGIGTDTVTEELKRIFPEAKIFKIDKDSVKTAVAVEKIIAEFHATPGSILVGTEMVFSYLKEKVHLSVIASFDSLWSIPNFKMSEKIIHIIISIIGNTKEKLIIQTKNENDPAIIAVENQNLLSFIMGEIEDRKNLGYPPFQRFIKLVFTGDKDETIQVKKFLAENFQDYHIEVFSGFVAKMKGKYVTNMLIKIEPAVWSLPELKSNSKIDNMLYSKLLPLASSFEIFVDPEDLL